MKILFLNISDVHGGSAMAAYRLSDGMQKYYQTENYFIVRTKQTQLPNVFASRETPLKGTIERYVNIAMNAAGLQYYYLPFSPRVIFRLVEELKPDIINLNNIIGGYFQTQDLIKLSTYAPIVWTLHDMWAMTANASYTFEDESFLSMKKGKKEQFTFPWIGLNTGTMLLKRKKEIYSKSRFTIAAPSRWLFNYAAQSPVFEGKDIRHIPYGIDLSLFSPASRAAVRSRFNIPEDAAVLIFTVEKLSSMFKGTDLLKKIIRLIDKRITHKIYFIVVGEGSLSDLNLSERTVLIQPGFISKQRDLIDYYSSADLLLHTARADNLPLVLIESIACGTPGITFRIGGCPEILKEHVSGFTIEPFDVDAYANKVIELIEHKEVLQKYSRSAREFAEATFDDKKNTALYHELFCALAGKK